MSVEDAIRERIRENLIDVYNEKQANVHCNFVQSALPVIKKTEILTCCRLAANHYGKLDLLSDVADLCLEACENLAKDDSLGFEKICKKAMTLYRMKARQASMNRQNIPQPVSPNQLQIPIINLA